MSVRRLGLFAVLAGAVLGALIPPASFAGEPVRMLVTFLGLVSASILPTVSLAIGSMSGAGRSVLKIDELFSDLKATSAALFKTMLSVGFVFAALVLFAMMPVVDISVSNRFMESEIPDAVRRGVQIFVFGGAVMAVGQAYRIPRTFLQVLKIKRDIAIHEARKELLENAPGEAEIKSIFPTKDGFGKKVALEQ